MLTRRRLYRRNGGTAEVVLTGDQATRGVQTFIGRQAELRLLADACEHVANGEPEIVMLVGEPGIGKTALCGQLASEARKRGAEVLVGHSYGEASLALPYMAFVEALRPRVLGTDSQQLQREVGTGAEPLARIIPEIAERLSFASTPAGESDERRWRLLNAVSDYLNTLSSPRPVILILEDLHWADSGTLDLLLHVGRNLRGHLLLVGTCRDTEVDRAHPLSRVLVQLGRATVLNRVGLSGLSLDEVQALCEDIHGGAVSRSRAELIRDQTDGNPLFVREVARGMSDERTHKGTARHATVPEALQDVVTRRLRNLSSDCQNMLQAAAIAGREVRLDVISHVTGITDRRLVAALDEACDAGILEELTRVGEIGYRFAHAFFRETLYEETSALKRQDLHSQIGRAVESMFPDHLDDHASELSEHFGHSASRRELAKAAKYAEVAAEQALSMFAYSEAARLFQRALDIQKELGEDVPVRQCDLLLRLGLALEYGGEPQRVIDEVGPAALRLAQTLGDDERTKSACYLAWDAILSFGSTAAIRRLNAYDWVRIRWPLAEPDTVDRVYADVQLAVVKCAVGESDDEVRALMVGAADLARRLDEPAALGAVDADWLLLMRAPRFAAETFAAADRLLAQMANRGVSDASWFRLHGRRVTLYFLVDIFLKAGQREKAEWAWGQLQALHGRTRQPHTELIELRMRSCFAALDGRLDEALENTHQVLRRGEELALEQYAIQTVRQGPNRAAIWLGRIDNLRMVNELDEPDLGPLMIALERHEPEPRKSLDEIAARCRSVRPEDDHTPTELCASWLEAAVITAHKSAAEALVERFEDSGLVTSGFRSYGPVSISRLLGDAYQLLGDVELALASYERSLVEMEAMRFRPEIALTRLGLAEVMLGIGLGQPPVAREHLAFATRELKLMGMKPALARARRLARSSGRETMFPDGLSEREVEVLRLVASGKSNQEIAEELVIGLNTVLRHVANIFAKTACRNRVEATAYAHRRALV